jgi:hypothetical protein
MLKKGAVGGVIKKKAAYPNHSAPVVRHSVATWWGSTVAALVVHAGTSRMYALSNTA